MTDFRTVWLPSAIRQTDIDGRCVVVFDVFRATTTITTAIASGAQEIRVFNSISDAADASRNCAVEKLLAGEVRCLPPDGFDLGNSPADFTHERVARKCIYFATTNGTAALRIAAQARRLLAGSLRNASAVAKALHEIALPVTLLCAGTEGSVSVEDLCGCGAVIDAFDALDMYSLDDGGLIALQLFKNSVSDLAELLSRGRAASNLRRAQLTQDISFCAQLSKVNVVAECDTTTMTLRAYSGL